MDVLLGMTGLIGVIVCAIILIVLAIRKKPKKKTVIVLIAFFALFWIGMAISFSKEETVTKAEYDELVSELKNVNLKLSQKSEEYDALLEEYTELQENAASFMQLTEDEQAAELARAEQERIEAEQAAQAAQEEADRIAAEKAAEEEAQRQAEEASRLAEEAKGYETGITYEDLSRSPDDYIGQKVKFTGTVVQIMESSYQNIMRLATSDYYEDIIYGTYDPDILDVRLLEDDNITIYGTAQGIETYEAVLGNTISLPKVSVDRIELN